MKMIELLSWHHFYWHEEGTTTTNKEKKPTERMVQDHSKATINKGE